VGNDLNDDVGNTLISLIFGGGEPVVPPGGDWTPADLAVEAIVWMDATVGVSDTAGDVDTWTDQTSNGYVFEDKATVNKPVTDSVTQNGLNVLHYDVATLTRATDITGIKCCMAVCGDSLASVVGPLHGQLTGSSNNYTFLWHSSSSYDISIDGESGNSGNASVDGNDTVSGGNINLPEVTNVTNRDWHSWYMDYNNPVDVAWLGTSLSGAGIPSYGEFNLAEMIFLDYVPSVDDKQLMEGYLMWKWGLEANLPVGHPYKSAAPTT
jgi:hypothetical protein